MEILWFNFAFVYISSLFSRFLSRPLEHEPYIKPNKLLVLFTMLSLILVAGLRRNIGDTYFYMHAYEVDTFQLSQINFKDEFGFYFLQWLLHRLSDNPQILVFVAALITNGLIVLVLYKYSRMFELGIYVYIASGAFTVSMNGIRQSLAAAIIFAATKYILEGHWKRFILVVLLAATIHQSALIFIPIYFIVRRKAWTKVTFLLLLGAVVIAFGFNTFSSLLFDALSDTKYGHYSTFSEGGANILRIAVTAVPLLIAYLGRERLRAFWPKSDYIVNLSLLGFIFMIIASKNWIFARFDIYFDLYSLILITWIIPLFIEKNRFLVYYGVIVCYFIYFYYEQVVTLGIEYNSDYIH
ncbi:transmembrane protein EpsG [Pullulanibacillus pueri]|uniref:Transmembrane protein EpsG n=1 Tax=Pullulanibacillus pueri TaxID=1437324 RepID=A0A8J3EM88_9BACL|nr:EpsG family protein [Pullulanibacillus pueri]MBM7682426.1 transmembrane protein EpsG [Pullulanibacillus pueri]GGH81685.1 transmembrane protein EpsG [Pullulanibacillus pueri]